MRGGWVLSVVDDHLFFSFLRSFPDSPQSGCPPLLALPVPSSSSWQDSGSSEQRPLGHMVADRAEQEAAQLVPRPQVTVTVDMLARQQGADKVSLLKLIVFS